MKERTEEGRRETQIRRRRGRESRERKGDGDKTRGRERGRTKKQRRDSRGAYSLYYKLSLSYFTVRIRFIETVERLSLALGDISRDAPHTHVTHGGFKVVCALPRGRDTSGSISDNFPIPMLR